MVDNVDYVRRVAKTIKDLMIATGMTNRAIGPRRVTSFAHSKSYNVIVACFDMFWCKFKDAPFCEARVGTLTCRFKDCSILGALDYLCKLMGIRLGELIKWMFSTAVTYEMEFIMDSPDELGKDDSYTPYLNCFALCEKSYYSATTCPNIHLWVHIIGVTLQGKRSKDARMLEASGRSEVPRAAMLVAYAFQDIAPLIPGFYNTGLEENEINEMLKEPMINSADDDSNEPQDRIPLAWFSWFMGLNFKYPPKMLAFIHKIQDGIDATREGTIGDYLKVANFV